MTALVVTFSVGAGVGPAEGRIAVTSLHEGKGMTIKANLRTTAQRKDPLATNRGGPNGTRTLLSSANSVGL